MIVNKFRHVRNLLGVICKDWLRYARALGDSSASYLSLCNRNELLEPAPDGKGHRCDWQWTSDLHAPKYLPGLGLQLMKRALAEHPIIRSQAPAVTGRKPDITYLIGHRGLVRLPHLLATLESIAGQTGAVVECIVVEQDVEARLAGKLSAWVRHVHTPPPAADMPYCRSWTFNIGVKHAQADVVVLHDNDMLIPTDYSTSILEKVRNGYEVVNLKRFIFYLTEEHSNSVFTSNAELFCAAPDYIVQNLEAGGSVAITKKSYEKIGGLDESFIGWGGEDNEFWERAQTLKVWPYAFLPIVHLWHAAQPGKLQSDTQTLKHYRTLSAMSVTARIATLNALQIGQVSGPVGWRDSIEDR